MPRFSEIHTKMLYDNLHNLTGELTQYTLLIIPLCYIIKLSWGPDGEMDTLSFCSLDRLLSRNMGVYLYQIKNDIIKTLMHIHMCTN